MEKRVNFIPPRRSFHDASPLLHGCRLLIGLQKNDRVSLRTSLAHRCLQRITDTIDTQLTHAIMGMPGPAMPMHIDVLPVDGGDVYTPKKGIFDASRAKRMVVRAVKQIIVWHM